MVYFTFCTVCVGLLTFLILPAMNANPNPEPVWFQVFTVGLCPLELSQKHAILPAQFEISLRRRAGRMSAEEYDNKFMKFVSADDDFPHDEPGNRVGNYRCTQSCVTPIGERCVCTCGHNQHCDHTTQCATFVSGIISVFHETCRSLF